MAPQFPAPCGSLKPQPLPANYRRVVIGTRKSRLERRLLGSALSALVGWLALAVPVVLLMAISNWPSAATFWQGFADFAVVTLPLVFFIWLLFLLPLYLHVPRSSFLWRWPFCTLCGAIVGGLMMFLPFLIVFGWISDPAFLIAILLAAYTAAATCLFGALTAPRFHDLQNPENV